MGNGAGQEHIKEKLLAIAHGDPLPEDFDFSLALAEILQRAAGETTGITYVLPDGSEDFQSYSELLAEAQCILSGLRALGLQSQDKVILQLQRDRNLGATLWGCWLGGFVPVPIGIAPSYTQDNSKANLLCQAWQLCDCPIIISDNRLTPAISAFLDTQIVAVETLKQNFPDKNWHSNQPDDLALLLMTSGSTGLPKGVMLNARNLLVSAFGMASVNGLAREDITLNWMPLEHVASLVMFHFTEVYLGCQQIHVANEIILQNPLKWLDFCDHYRVTATWAPNFAYGLINECAEAIAQQHWDLSCLRWMGNGAEAVVGKTARRFLELLAPYGLASNAVSPGYGMSETCSGIVHSRRFSRESTKDEDSFVEVGKPIPGVSVRIVDSHNQVVAEGTIGLLQVKGLTVTSGYFNREQGTGNREQETGTDAHTLQATAQQEEHRREQGVWDGVLDSYKGTDKKPDREIFTDDGWFNTGDLGFLQEGRLTITGRQKEVIIINGVNYYNHEIEAAITEVDGLEASYTAACSVRGIADTTDKLAIFFTPAFAEDEFSLELIKKIRKILISKVGVYPDYLIPVARTVIPKTAIGKIQRQQLSQRFESGNFQATVERVKVLLASQKQDLPKNDLERQIAEIWQEVLNVEQVSLQDNFFELGGNSLLLMQVLAKLQERLQRQLSAVEMFQYPAIATLANYLSQAQTEANAVRQGQQKAQRRQKPQSPEIAVIGMSCRFPGAKNIEEFWQNLCEGVESISFLTDEEILASGIDSKLLNNANYVKASPILEEIEQFDAEFFSYSRKEAELIDPQQRLLLECAWESLEHAGYNPFIYQGEIALYAGASANTYLLNNVYPNRHQIDETDHLQVVNLGSMAGFQMTVANDKDYLTTRVSYKLNLTGASVNVQTACSTSLVAIHLACQSLLWGECDMVLAGGVSVHAPQKVGYLYQEGTILSPDGHCRAFDARAQGTLFGSGAGIVVLKRLDEAIRDGDCIYAVIKGSAIDNDGGTKVGYFAPNCDGQAKVIAEAMAIAGVNAETISYVEAHGTGTPLGDPIEVAALTQAFRHDTNKKNFCAIASVKTNVGHLNIASGVAGFIKTVLSLYHKKLPPSLHFESPNPQIDFANSPFFVNTSLKDWNIKNFPRRAGVNSLGIGGTNVHVVLEEAIPPTPLRKGEYRGESPLHLLTLSARNEEALRELVKSYRDYLTKCTKVSLSDICFTANTGRSHFNYRLCILSASVAQLREQIDAYLTGKEVASVVSGQVKSSQPPKIAFLFTGQGSQYVGMGKELYETQPTFRAVLDSCAEILKSYLDIPLLEILYPKSENSPPLPLSPSPPLSLIDETIYTQPALFSLEYALYQLWKSWGIEPSAVMGHSVGEYVAACVAGVFSLEDGLKLIAARGRLMQQLPHDGTMVAVFASEEKVSDVIKPYQKQVALAAINGAENLVISGKRETIEEIIANLQGQGIQTKQLNVSHAFHSPLMEPILTEFEQIAGQIIYSLPQIDLISNLTGKIINEEIATPQYWVKHIRQPVQFAQSIKTLHQLGYQSFVEIGAKPTLLGMGRAILDNSDFCLWLPSLRPGYSNWEQLLGSLAQLYAQGITINWFGFDRDYSRRRVALPTYPFQRKRYWIEANLQFKIYNPVHPLLGQKLRSPLKEIIFESQLAPNTPAFLKDHRIFQQTVLPGTAYLEMALASGAEVFKSNNLMIEDFIVQQALTLPENKTQNVQIILSKESTGTSFQIYSLVSENDSWQLHSSGKIITTEQVTESIDIAQLRGHFANEISVKTHYQQCREQGIDYGLSFRAIAQLWSQNNEALGLIKITEETSQYHFHPALLDACLQVIFAAVPSDLKSETYLPLGLERFCFYRHPKQTLWSHVRLRPFNKLTPEIIVADVSIFDENGNLIARIEGISSKRASRQNLLGGGREKSWHDWLYQIEWQIQSKSQTSDFYPTSDSWLFLVDEGKVVEQLSAFLDSQKQRNIFIFSVEVNQKIEYFCEVINIIKNQELSIGNIVYLCNLNNLETTIQRECSNVLDLVQSLVQAELTYSPRLWIVTRGAQAFKNDNSSLLNLTQSCLWGMGKVIALEHPEFNCTCIDLDPKSTENEIQKLCAEIASPDSENQIAFRDGKRYVARLVPYRFQENSEQNAISTQLTIENRGTLDNLRWQPATRRQPNADEVEIQVRATGLNFRDVLNVLGLYPGDPGLLGLECTGEIVATGQGVQDFQIGDAVVAIAPGSFSQYVTVSASLVVPKPHYLSFEEAATIPSAFLTAYYTLHHLAKIKQGDRVLIHAAAGGVGLAAIQIAQQAGAAIFATASPSKWDFLKSWGVQHVMNSRTLDFADEVMSATQGEGVDIVLNSLSGEFIPKSLSVLSSKGRFIEIGKNGAWEPERVAQFAPNLSYFLIDLVEVTQQQPDLINSMLRHVMQQLAAGNLKPLPCQIFKRDRVVDAFRTMQQAQHIGKIVVSQEAGGRRQEAGGRSRDTKFCVFTEIQDDGIYLITGGLGGLGLQIARWLVDKGARHLILVGRSEVSQAARETINQLEQAGARISVVQADISKLDDITRILPLSPSSPHPLIPSPPSQLRGIIHAAGILDDSVLTEQTWERFERVMEPKIKGAWNLHLATQNYPLDFFVLFSSAASVVGSAGQANYAAANAFLDALAYYRRTMGLTGTSINWGIWSSVGMAAQLTERDRFRLEKQGMSAIAVEQGLQILEKLLACDPVQVCVLPIDWSAFLKQLPNNRILPFFEKVRPALAEKIQPEFLEHLKAATPSDRTLLLIDRIKVYVAKILRIESPETIDIEQGFTELGMDSLSSVELRNQLQTNLQLTLPSTLIFDYPSICAIANYLEQKIFASVSHQKQEKTLDPTLAEIENLSESEAEALLLKELLGDE